MGLAMAWVPGHEVQAENQGVIVIANPSVVETSIDRRTLASIFLKRKMKWSNGDHIEIVTLSGGDLHRRFLQDYIRKTEEQYRNHWTYLVFSGTGRPPVSLDTEREVVSFVTSVRGAIGYVSTDTDLGGAKRITVQD
jgi:ABC-type phosphate transport system substrate-binding protein